MLWTGTITIATAAVSLWCVTLLLAAMSSSSFLLPGARRTFQSTVHHRHDGVKPFNAFQPPPSVTTKLQRQGSSLSPFSNILSSSYNNAARSFVRRRHSSLFSTISSSSSDVSSRLSKQDEEYMEMALSYAKKGFGRTFPNPAVGCVLVAPSGDTAANNNKNHNNNMVIVGAGFHPQAGYPHAEVFALLQAYGYVESGVKAAESVIAMSSSSTSKPSKPETSELFDKVQQLALQYASPDGPSQLFGPSSTSRQLPIWLQNDQENSNSNINSKRMITAYVTLEPCCHYGKTPPCAMALMTTGHIQRVVVGLRDPNPKVQGGGIQLLLDAGIDVHVVPTSQEISLYTKCQDMVASFVQRITRPPLATMDVAIKGAQRATLRSKAHIQKANGSLVQVTWPGPRVIVVNKEQDEHDETKLDNVLEDDDDDSSTTTTTTTKTVATNPWQTAVDAVGLDAAWLESLDQHLWEQELVLLRLNTAVEKRKWAERLGQRIAQAVQAQVIQSVGHTVLLYRPNVQEDAATPNHVIVEK